MKQRGRRSSKASAVEVVDLVSSGSEGVDTDADVDTAPAPAPAPAPARTTTTSSSRRASRGKGRAAAAAAAAAIAGSAQAAAADDDADCEFVDSDFEAEAEQQQAVPLGRKRALPAGRPASGAGGKRGAAAAAAALPTGPAVKKARTAAAAATAADGGGAKAGGSRGNSSSKGSKALTGKAAAAKGFSALFLRASQHTGGSQGSADAAGSQQAAAAGAPLQLTGASAAAATAATGVGGPAAAAGEPAAAELWVDKCAPQTVAELVVHKKKVSEVQDWLNFYLQHRARHHTRALLVTGPPGCGKSLTVRLVAASLGFDVMEWTPPVPTLWADHQYMAGAGVRYSSKLDDFDMFVARAKFAALPLLTCNATQQQQQQQPQMQQQQPQTQTQQQQQQASQQQPQQTQPSQQQQQTQHQQQHQPPASSKAQQKQKLLLVEDLPHVGDPERRARLSAALRELATTARCPVVVVATTEEGSGGGGGGKGGGYGSYGAAGAGMTIKGLHKDFVSVLDQCGAGSISFNPITGPNLSRALTAIAEGQGYCLDSASLAGVVAGAGGDLRNAIQNLQLVCQGPGAAVRAKQPGAAAGKKGGKAKAAKRPRKATQLDPEAAAAAEAVQASVAAQVCRDQGLSVFHAIGKLLHYKRSQEAGSTAAAAAAPGGRGGAAEQQQQQQQEEGSDGDCMDAEGGPSQQQDRCDTQQKQQQQQQQQRPPLRLNPEGVIQGSGLEALAVVSFLSENYPHFMADDAMGEVAEAAAALSNAGYMCCYRNTAAPSVAFWDEGDPNAASLASAAAVSVAARGLLWANRRPAPSRWLPLKGPSCFLPERAATTNMGRLSGALQALQDEASTRRSSSSSGGGHDVMALAGQLLHAGRQDRAAQVLPYLQVLAAAPSRLWLHALLPRSWAYTWQGSICERPSQALQGQGAAAVAAALEAAAAAAGATAERGLSHRADRGGGGVVVQEEHEAEEGQEESDEGIESDSD